YLVMSPGIPHARERLVEFIWPHSTSSGGRASLRQALSGVRAALDDTDGELLVANRDAVSLQADGVRSDAGLLECLVCGRADVAQSVPELRGTFLDGLTGISAAFDNWRATEEARLSALAVRYFRQMAEKAAVDQHLGEAAAFLSRALEIDPMDEALTRRLMQVYVRQGHSAKALGQFRALKMQMQSDLGIAPERETQDLAREIHSLRQRSPALSKSKVGRVLSEELRLSRAWSPRNVSGCSDTARSAISKQARRSSAWP
ncbi:MAG: BTAD domain-containing putative transcriptional regulator, partial [Paracoccaceae bacterium]